MAIRAAYARGDLVTVGTRSAVATADHEAGVWADDLAAGLWVMNSSSVDALNPPGHLRPDGDVRDPRYRPLLP